MYQQMRANQIAITPRIQQTPSVGVPLYFLISSAARVTMPTCLSSSSSPKRKSRRRLLLYRFVYASLTVYSVFAVVVAFFQVNQVHQYKSSEAKFRSHSDDSMVLYWFYIFDGSALAAAWFLVYFDLLGSQTPATRAPLQAKPTDRVASRCSLLHVLSLGCSQDGCTNRAQASGGHHHRPVRVDVNRRAHARRARDPSRTPCAQEASSPAAKGNGGDRALSYSHSNSRRNNLKSTT